MNPVTGTKSSTYTRMKAASSLPRLPVAALAVNMPLPMKLVIFIPCSTVCSMRMIKYNILVAFYRPNQQHHIHVIYVTWTRLQAFDTGIQFGKKKHVLV